MKNILVFLASLIGFSSVSASEFRPNHDANKQTILALIEAGSNPRKAHPLEHHFYFISQESIDSLMAKGKSLGYAPANIGEAEEEGKKYWYGDLIKKTALDIKLINKENSLMLELASEFNAEYDGWGTPVVE